MDSVKVHFRLVQDADDYPPASVESVWAHKTTGPGEYVLDNVPFFAREATIGDVVLVHEEAGDLWFCGVARRSENSLIRVVFCDPAAFEKVNGRLVALGCTTEYLEAHHLLAVCVPSEVKLRDVQDYLRSEARAGKLDYEEPILRQ